MEAYGDLIRPATLVAGAEYLWRPPAGPQLRKTIRVKFVAYDHCPAVVYIATDGEKVVRCRRDELFARGIPDSGTGKLLIEKASIRVYS